MWKYLVIFTILIRVIAMESYFTADEIEMIKRMMDGSISDEVCMFDVKGQLAFVYYPREKLVYCFQPTRFCGKNTLVRMEMNLLLRYSPDELPSTSYTMIS